jgi:hypothetical protein
MYYFTVTQKIENFEKFKPVFDSDEERRQSLGINTIAILRGLENENDITILMSAPDMKTIEERTEDNIVREKMKLAGVISKPEWKIYKS